MEGLGPVTQENSSAGLSLSCVPGTRLQHWALRGESVDEPGQLLVIRSPPSPHSLPGICGGELDTTPVLEPHALGTGF